MIPSLGLLLLSLAPQVPFEPQGIDPIRPAPPTAGRLLRRPFVTWVTGEWLGTDVVFRVRFDPARAGSAKATIAVVEPRGAVDGIDFVPGLPEVAATLPSGILAHYDLASGAVLPDFLPDTDAIPTPPATPGTHPSTVWSTPTHAYYIENQFGFGATISHRIVRHPWAGGPTEVVYDGAVHGLKYFEGLEGVAGRLYFFAEDPGLPTARALVSIGTAGGLWNGLAPAVHVGGLFEAPGGSDGSDELDFDPASGLLFGTNIVNGEVIAWHPGAGLEVSSPGALHFVDAGQILASVGALAALGDTIDGVRSVGNGWLLFSGKAGTLVSLSIPGVLADGADDGDARVLLSLPGTASFDDLTPIRRL